MINGYRMLLFKATLRARISFAVVGIVNWNESNRQIVLLTLRSFYLACLRSSVQMVYRCEVIFLKQLIRVLSCSHSRVNVEQLTLHNSSIFTKTKSPEKKKKINYFVVTAPASYIFKSQKLFIGAIQISVIDTLPLLLFVVGKKADTDPSRTFGIDIRPRRSIVEYELTIALLFPAFQTQINKKKKS